MRRFICLLVFLPFLSIAGTKPITKAYTLKNGLKLIVRVDRRAPVVLSSIWYNVGSGNEHSGITGISHMLEHMMFKGTQKYPTGTLIKTVVQRGGSQNAQTGFDHTMYYQLWSKENLAQSFRFEADRMQHLVFNPAEFKKEHQVVMEERRLRTDDNPIARFYERFNAALFVNSPYHHLPIGWMTDIRQLTLKDLQYWYRQWYVPNNALIVVVGDVNPAHVYALAKQYFGSIPRHVLPVVKSRTEIPPMAQKTLVMHSDAQTPIVFMGYQVPSFATTKAMWQPRALQLLATLLGDSYSSRLTKDLVIKRHLASSVSVSYNMLAKHQTGFMISAVPQRAGQEKILIVAIKTELKRLRQQRVTAAELNRAKARYRSALVFEQDKLDDQASFLAIPALSGLSWHTVYNLAAFDAITPQQIQQVVKQYLKVHASTIAILKPKSIAGEK